MCTCKYRSDSHRMGSCCSRKSSVTRSTHCASVARGGESAFPGSAVQFPCKPSLPSYALRAWWSTRWTSGWYRHWHTHRSCAKVTGSTCGLTVHLGVQQNFGADLVHKGIMQCHGHAHPKTAMMCYADGVVWDALYAQCKKERASSPQMVPASELCTSARHRSHVAARSTCGCKSNQIHIC